MITKMIVGHKVASVVTAVALGTTGATAAATGNVPFVETDDAPTVIDADLELVEVEEVVEVEESEDDGEVKVPTEPPVGADGVPYGDVACDEAKNHGEYVSGVAKDDSIAEGERGEIMSQAAKTDCGKKDKAEKDAEKEERKADREADKAERDAAKEERKAERDAEKEERKAEKEERKADDDDDDDEVEQSDHDVKGPKGKKDKDSATY